MRNAAIAISAVALAGFIGIAQAQDNSMSFFVTSAGPGKGADLGGLAGADAHCQSLADAAGSSGKTWRAYLSTSAENAKDRIGAGPWSNAKGEKIADDVASLHGDANNLTKQTALNEKGEVKLSYRPVHTEPRLKPEEGGIDPAKIAPKARVY